MTRRLSSLLLAQMMSGMIDKLDNSKKTSGCISVDILKLISDLCHVEITNHFNKMLITNVFPTLSRPSTYHRYIKVQNGCISVDILKLISDLCHVEITNHFNKMLITNVFPDPLKAFIGPS